MKVAYKKDKLKTGYAGTCGSIQVSGTPGEQPEESLTDSVSVNKADSSTLSGMEETWVIPDMLHQ